MAHSASPTRSAAHRWAHTARRLLVWLGAALLAGCGAASRPAVVGTQTQPEFSGQQFVLGVGHPHFPLSLGTTRTYLVHSAGPREVLVVETLARVVTIGGVVCTVVIEAKFLDDVLAKTTESWFVQDTQGNVWAMGEEETAPQPTSETLDAWQAGAGGALPGIAMFAFPAVGSTFRGGSGPGVEDELAEVAATGETITVAGGTFPGCIEIRETKLDGTGDVERAWYAPGVGLVLQVDAEGTRTELLALAGR